MYTIGIQKKWLDDRSIICFLISIIITRGSMYGIFTYIDP